MASPPIGNYWVIVERSNGAEEYFARFTSHTPTVRFISSRNRGAAYCFASIQDAQRVVDQFIERQRRGRIVTERPKPAPPVAATPPPPDTLRPWINAILQSGSGKENVADQITAGYRALTRRYHPDHGGSNSDMQYLNDAVRWLRKEKNLEDDVPSW